jgi:hypothetical protein
VIKASKLLWIIAIAALKEVLSAGLHPYPALTKHPAIARSEGYAGYQGCFASRTPISFMVIAPSCSTVSLSALT